MRDSLCRYRAIRQALTQDSPPRAPDRERL